jgi:hypothetical protein
MEDFKVTNIPTTIICSKATSDIKEFLEQIQNEQQLSSDLMCMVLRDCCSYFERKRADDYCNAIIKDTAMIQLLQAENEKLKQATKLFDDLEAQANDNTKSEH